MNRGILLILGVIYLLIGTTVDSGSLLTMAAEVSPGSLLVAVLRVGYATAGVLLVVTWITDHQFIRALAQALTFLLIAIRVLSATAHLRPEPLSGRPYGLVVVLLTLLVLQVYVIENGPSR